MTTLSTAKRLPEISGLPGVAALTGLTGLTSEEAARRNASGRGNRPSKGHGRTVGEIVRANVFTRFNAILGALFVVIITLGPFVDGLFGIVLVANALVGIAQEVRAKQTLDRLSLITATKSTVLRDGKRIDLDPFAIVQGDLIELRSGAQVVADGPVEASDGLEIDESLLTGEADPQVKAPGDGLRSGSFVVAGTGWFRAEKVGDASFANALSAEARKFTPVKSELGESTDALLRIVTWAIGPIALALLVGQRLGGETWKHAVFGAATGVVEIVPEGFVFLTSMTLAMSIIRLGRNGVLVKELAAVEGLARVDTVCFDKTGTLTEGQPVVEDVIAFVDESIAQIEAALRSLTVGSGNATAAAIATYLAEKGSDAVTGNVTPFSSARKWAAVTVTDSTSADSSGTGHAVTWVMGAPEIVVANWQRSATNTTVFDEVAKRAAAGLRVLLVASANSPMPSEGLPSDLRAVGLVTLKEQIRRDAAITLEYFAEQEVAVKVISGDNPTTVAAIARVAGLSGLDDATSIVDARTLTDDDALSNAIGSALIVGRTTPLQKRAMVTALQAQNRTVAMTGDGVNDALALKAADLGIAMGSGSEATKAVAQLILLDGGFAALPGVVAEGRRVIANVERVAKLFVNKTVYAAALAVATGVARLPFPFLPRHLTLVSSLTIGFPGFFLAFAPDAPVAKSGLMRRVAIFSIPVGLVAAIATFSAYAAALVTNETSIIQARTTATMVLGLVGLWVVDVLARAMWWRGLLVGAMGFLGVVSGVIVPIRNFWELEFPPVVVLVEAVAIAGIAIAVIEVGWRLAHHLESRGLTREA